MAEAKKLKIGILTFYYAHNYGAVLQCYALQQALKTSFPDAEVCVVDYENKKIKDDYKIFYLNKKNPYRFLRSLFGTFVYFFNRVKRSFVFHNFVKNNLNIGSSNFNDYDVIFYGSDQIWNPVIFADKKNPCLDKIYLGAGFAGKKIAYGASDGNKLVLSEDVKELLNSFSAISVREKTLAKKLSLLDKTVSVVSDPVFLLSKEDWLKISVTPKEENYIFAYKIAENLNFDREVEASGEKLNKKVIQAVYVKSIKKIFCKKQKFVVAISPLEFIGYIANADFVVTTSFHGTAFSCLFEKKFCVLKIKEGSERITDLLNILGLENRYVESISQITDFEEDIHNDRVKQKMNDYKDKSRNWLSESIGKTSGGGYKRIVFFFATLQSLYGEAVA